MTTTLATLAIDPDIMRGGNEDILTTTRYNDAALIALMQTTAKNKLKTDLMLKVKIPDSTTDHDTYIDEIIDKYTEIMQNALMYLQLYYYYYQNDEIGSLNESRKRENWYMYDAIAATFNTFKTDNIQSSGLIRMTRG